MRKTMAVIMSILLVGTVVGCENSSINKQGVGAVTGGILGGVLGNQVGGGNGRIAATIGGTLLGAYLGGSIGKSMDDVDRMKMNSALETTRTGQTTSWANPDSGNNYTVTPTKTYHSAGRPCRDYTTIGVIGGKRQTIYGRACRQADGTWQAKN
jgi:surface antigen